MNRRRYKQFPDRINTSAGDRNINERYAMECDKSDRYTARILQGVMRTILAIFSATVVVMLIIELIR